MKKWAEKEGFTHIVQTDISGRYFKVDPDGFGIIVRWYYNDDTNNHGVKWQSWIGNDKRNPTKMKWAAVPDRKVYIEVETDMKMFTDYYGGRDKMATYIKTNNNRMIKLLKGNINKQLKKLQD